MCLLSIRKAASTGLPRTMSTLALRAGNSSPCKWTAMPRALCNFALMVLSFSAALPSLVCLLAISSPGKSSTRLAARHNLYRHVRRACEMPLLVQQDAQTVKGRVELIVLLPQGIVELNSSLHLDFPSRAVRHRLFWISFHTCCCSSSLPGSAVSKCLLSSAI